MPVGAATFTVPGFFGQANSTYQEWQSFTNPAGPNAATALANAAGTPNWFDRTAAADGAFLTGGHVYSFSGVVNPQVDVPTPTLATAGLTQIVLQTEVLGSPLDLNSFRATSFDGKLTSATPAIKVAASGSGMGATYDYVVTWTNLPASTGYTITYSPNATSSSQTGARVDTVSAVPEPGTLTAICVAALGLLRRRQTV